VTATTGTPGMGERLPGGMDRIAPSVSSIDIIRSWFLG
jgi:hypothetical protein